MNLLVTGGAGFIGSNLIRQVIGKAEIQRLINLDCLTYAGHLENLVGLDRHEKYAFEKVDLREKSEVIRVIQQHRVSHILHLAAESHVDRSITGPGDFIHTNVVGTFHLLEAARDNWSDSPANKRFHHVSTDEVYGSLGPTGVFTEQSPYAPNSPYSASKAASDLLVRAYFKTYQLPVLITNCSNNYGPYQFPEKLIPVVIEKVLSRQPIPVYGDGMNVRDWLYVTDHAEALWLVLTRGRVGETYNVGGDNEQPNLRLIELICDLIDELKPPADGRPSRRLISFVKDRPGHDRRYAIDAAKIRSELSWKPKYSLETGLRETIDWYLKNGEWFARVTRPRSL